jgi:hypothetical protein
MQWVRDGYAIACAICCGNKMILTKSHLTNIVSRNVTVAWGGWYMAELAGSGLADVAGMVGLAKLMGRGRLRGGKGCVGGWLAGLLQE